MLVLIRNIKEVGKSGNMYIEFFQIILSIILLLPCLVILILCLLSVFTPILYLFGYVYDCFLADVLIVLTRGVQKRVCNIDKAKVIVEKLLDIMQPRSVYLRYETPVFAFCFSYMPIYMLISLIAYDEKGVLYIVFSVVYTALYFVGMAMKCRRNSEYYSRVLENNLAFVKLSFVPLGGIITIVGFLCTVSGRNIGDFVDTYSIVNKVVEKVLDLSNINFWTIIPYVFCMCLVIMILMYIISIPIQAVAYVVILSIMYLRKYKNGYCKLIKKYFTVIKYVVKKFI